MQKRRPVMLVVLDGWGWREEAADNAVRQARTPSFDRLWASWPARAPAHVGQGRRPAARADGQFRGRTSQHRRRPRGDAGPAAHQRRHRQSGEIEKAPALRPDRAPEEERRHLPSDGPGLARRRAFAPGSRRGARKNSRRAGVPTVVHAFTDGRDTPPQSAGADHRASRSRRCRHRLPIATVIGRYYAMDRDKRWERVAKAYDAIVEARGRAFPDAGAAIADAYAHDISDEFVRAGGRRRLSRHAGRRRRALLQLPRRPGARNPRRACSIRPFPASRAGAAFNSPPPSA